MNVSGRQTSYRSSEYDAHEQPSRANEAKQPVVAESSDSVVTVASKGLSAVGQVSKITEEMPSSLAVLNNLARTKRHNPTEGLSQSPQSNDAAPVVRHSTAGQASISSDADVTHARVENHAPPETDAPNAIAPQIAQASETPQQQDTKLRLADLDSRLGSLRFGNSSVSRMDLYEMGATFDGKKIGIKNANIRQSSQTVVDRLQFNPADLERYMQNVSPERADAALTLLYEVASARSPSAPPVLGEVPSHAAPPIAKVNALLNKAQAMNASANRPTRTLPAWVNMDKSQAIQKAGGSLQAYGIYAGLLGLRDSLKSGDAAATIESAGSVVAELGSMFVEHALEKSGTAMLQNGGKVFNKFASTSVGTKLIRGGGLIANALTLPFDIHSAVKSFQAAAQATGKEKQDHYVNAGFSLTSAGLSLVLGAASAAGFASTAGPVGLAAATLMIVGSQVYNAARQVDDIDDYIELSTAERWRTGWRAFWGKEPDESVTERLVVAKTEHVHAEQQKEAALRILESEQRVGAVVNGSFEVKLAPVKHWKFEWDESKGESPYTLKKEPVINETDDDVDASRGLDASMPGVVMGASGHEKAVLWRLGGGNDRVVGVENQANWFLFGNGAKKLTGGHQNDSFGLVTGAEFLKNGQPQQEAENVLDGGSGTDTISLLGKIDRGDHAYSGYDVDLQAGRLGLRRNSTDNEVVPFMRLKSIENVETVVGASSRITGSDDANEITVRGDDYVDAGDGDDTILIEGRGTVLGGSGVDRYIIEQGSGTVDIVEDGKESSSITLRWNMESIDEWRVEGNDLLVSSRRGADGELPGRTIRVAGVYREEKGTRILQNDKLSFHTEDGYTVAPDLPAELAGDQPSVIKAMVVDFGKVAPPPEILGSGVTPVSGQHASFYVGRGDKPVTLDVRTSDQNASTTIYLDYDKDEIAKTEYQYVVESNRSGNFDHLKYGKANLVITLKDGKVLTLNNVASNRNDNGTNVGGSVIASGFGLNHSFAITLRDGTSYRVEAPQHSYIDDRLNLGEKMVDGTPSLKLRYGKYAFNNPAFHKIIMGEKPLYIPDSSHPVTYELEGSGSVHDIYLRDNTTIRLSTAGAVARKTNASTWNLHVETLGDVDIVRDVMLEDGQLRIKGVVVKFPPVDDEDKPLENIRINTNSGVYVVDLLSENIVKE